MARRNKSAPLTVVALGLLAALIIGSMIQQSTVNRQNARIAELCAQRDQLIDSNARLREEIDFTYTDTYFRREAHRLGYIAADEILYTFD